MGSEESLCCPVSIIGHTYEPYGSTATTVRKVRPARRGNSSAFALTLRVQISCDRGVNTYTKLLTCPCKGKFNPGIMPRPAAGAYTPAAYIAIVAATLNGCLPSQAWSLSEVNQLANVTETLSRVYCAWAIVWMRIRSSCQSSPLTDVETWRESALVRPVNLGDARN